MTAPFDIEIEPAKLRQANGKDYAVRFAFGGGITLVTGLIAHVFGPLVGGLFLAFPAILPASVTLLQQHEDHQQAGIDAFGAALGAVGLLAFAGAIWFLAPRLPAWLVIALAAVLWLIASTVLWLVTARLHRDHEGTSP